MRLGRPAILDHPAKVLDSPQRRAILEKVRERPGLSIGELKQLTTMSWGPLYHHLLILERSGHVTTRKAGRRTVLAPASTSQDPKYLEARGLLKGESVRAIAAYIATHPHASMADVIQASSLGARGTYYHVQKLMRAGLVSSSSPTRHADLCATPLLEAALDLPEVP
jgi:predicted transcriptional regulator